MSDVKYYIGDSRTLLKNYEDESIHLIITSPPYWNAKDYGSDQIGFNQSYNEYIRDLNVVWKECARLLVPNGKMCIDIQPLPISKEHTNSNRSQIFNIMHDIESYMKELKLETSNMFIWDKRKYNNQRIFGSYPYPPNFFSHISFEYIFVFRKDGETRKLSNEIKENSKISMNEWKDWCFNSIWDIPPVIKFGKKNSTLGHIAPFPVEIPRRLIRLFSFVGDTVLDPFLGCGTTLGACILEDRNGIGIELQREYEHLIKLMITNPLKTPTYKSASVINKTTKITKISDFSGGT